MSSFENVLIIASLLLIASIAVSKGASRLGIPSLLLFLGVGILAGPHGLGHIVFPSHELARELGIFALMFILFSGAIDTEAAKARPVLAPALWLSTLGVVLTAVLIGLFAKSFLGFSLIQGGLLGATVASTDVAAVFTALRSRSMSLKPGLAPLLELESALNDPVTVLLTVTLLGWLSVGQGVAHSVAKPSAGHVAGFLVAQIVIGATLGWISGKLQHLLINRVKLAFEGLYPVLTLSCAMLTYAVAQEAGGSGFLAIYIAGVILGSANLLHKKSLIHFHEGIAWLAQIGMFLAMGLLVEPSELMHIWPLGVALSLFLVFIARPVSVFICLGRSRFNAREKLLVSWGGLRGAMPIILASYVLAAGIRRSDEIFNLVFFVTCLSVLLQGTTLPALAQWLGVDASQREKVRFPIELNPARDLRSKLLEVPVASASAAVGKSLLELNLPKDVLVILIQRGDDVLVPRGGTLIERDDVLLVLSEKHSAEQIKEKLG